MYTPTDVAPSEVDAEELITPSPNESDFALNIQMAHVASS